MTQPRPRQHCAYCAYRNAAGTLTIQLSDHITTEFSCGTCAREAADYYNGARARVRFSFKQ